MSSFASSYIKTVTVAVTRNADVLTYPSAGNVDGTKGWCSATYSSPAIAITNAMTVVGDDSNRGAILTRTITSGIHISDGTGLAAGPAGTPVANAQLKGATTWGSAGMLAAVNGGVGALASFDGDLGVDPIRIGSGNIDFFGNIRDVRIGQRALSSSELQAVST